METNKEFHIKILGKLLEHLGVQMYKHRDAAITELVANCWDAGANNVWITLPIDDNYDPEKSEILIEDDGCGMDENDLQDKYLVIGRNRRAEDNTESFNGRNVMGRKGIGKLAGFGISNNMTIITWLNDSSIELTLNLDKLKNNPVTETKEDIEKKLIGIVRDNIPFKPMNNSKTGTLLKLKELKQKSSINIDSLNSSLSRRFSRIVLGHMQIFINGEKLKPLSLDLHKNSPPLNSELVIETLSDNKEIKYSYSFSNSPITNSSLKGWTILVNGKTAQAPPFFFDVDSKGAVQHSSKYLIGTIEADFLDIGKDDKSDIISTDRQEVDWEREETKSLWEWGKRKTQEIFKLIGDRNSDYSENIALENETLKKRIDALDDVLRKQCLGFIRSIGKIQIAESEMPPKEKILQMADQIIKAFEYRHFVDVIDDIEKASESPENLSLLLSHLEKWEVLESRSILEIIKGRIKVIDKFQKMIVNRANETARPIGTDNFHDLLAGFPWLLNPEWQIFVEEKSISKILKEKGEKEIPELMKDKRVDFLALQGEEIIAIIEIKSADDNLPLEEIRRLEDYKIALSPAYSKNIICVLIYSGNHSVDLDTWNSYKSRKDFLIIEWKDIFTKNKKYYEHYRAVLENHLSHPNFHLKEREIINTRQILDKGEIYRTSEMRKAGIGPQDLNNETEVKKNTNSMTSKEVKNN